MSTPATAKPEFPLPQVEAALRPYIKTRQEVQAIRQGLQASFPVSPVNAAVPNALENLSAPRVGNLRKAYWRALQEHQRAQQKYDGLKAELEQLSHPSSSDSVNPSQDEDPTVLAENYLPLLRARETQRQLAVLENATSRIQAVGQQAQISEPLGALVKREVGDAPIPPATALTGTTRERDEADFDTDYHLGRLKKEMLALQKDIAGHEAAHQDVDLSNIPPQAELAALQAVHSELTAWMERQLALISDIGGGGEGNAAPVPGSDSAPPLDPALSAGGDATRLEDIETLYEQYLSTRRKLLRTIAKGPPDVESDIHNSSVSGDNTEYSSVGSTSRSTTNNPASSPETPSETPSETLLPFLSRLLAHRQTENILHHQTTHLRRQATHDDVARRDLLSRLAGESHLVTPSAVTGISGQDWAAAAAESDAATADWAMRKLRVGQDESTAALATLGEILGVPVFFEDLAGAKGQGVGKTRG